MFTVPAVKVTKRSTPFSNSNRQREEVQTISPTAEDSHPVEVGLICMDLGRLRADMKSAEALLPAKSDIRLLRPLPLVLLLLLQTLLVATLFLAGGGKLYMDLLTMLSLLSGGGRGWGMGEANSELRNLKRINPNFSLNHSKFQYLDSSEMTLGGRGEDTLARMPA